MVGTGKILNAAENVARGLPGVRARRCQVGPHPACRAVKRGRIGPVAAPEFIRPGSADQNIVSISTP